MNWKTWAVVGLIIVGVFAIYAFAATQSARISDDPLNVRSTTAATKPTVRPNTATAPAPGVSVIHTEWLETPSGSYKSERNLFAYKEPPPPPPVVPRTPVIVQPVLPPAPPAPVQPPEPQPPQPPQFPYHYIGTFGTQANPIATFSGDGKIINARTGETIDGKFILRGIGIESVEIGYVGFPPDVKTRVAIGQ